MRKRIFAKVLTLAICLSLIQPTTAFAVVIRNSQDNVILSWAWKVMADDVLTFNEEDKMWELSVPKGISEDNLLEILPKQITADVLHNSEIEVSSEENLEQQNPDDKLRQDTLMLALTWTITDMEALASEGAATVAANLPAGYVLADNAAPLIVKVLTKQAENFISNPQTNAG